METSTIVLRWLLAPIGAAGAFMVAGFIPFLIPVSADSPKQSVDYLAHFLGGLTGCMFGLLGRARAPLELDQGGKHLP